MGAGPCCADYRDRPSDAGGISDRAQDAWSPLFAIAHVLGGEWPERAKQAAILLTGGMAAESEDIGEQLLSDIHAIFQSDFPEADRILTADLLPRLYGIEGRPWNEWGKSGKPMTPHALAAELRRFNVRPGQGREPGNHNFRGYLLDDLKAAWERHPPL